MLFGNIRKWNSCLYMRILSLFFILLFSAFCAAADVPAARDIRENLKPSRLTIAMWDFSWICGHYPGGWAEDFNKVTDELIERKFNTVRIDACPMLIDTLAREGQSKRLFPAQPTHTWGFSTIDHEHDVVAELKAFMQIAKRKGLWVILSSWGRDKNEFYAKRENFWKAWETTLDILQKDGLLDHVLYVDFDQEFPYFSPFAAQLDGLAKEKAAGSEDMNNAMEQAGLGVGAWNGKQMAFVKDYFESTFAHFHEKYPGMRFTFSLTSFWNEVRAIRPKGMDVLELHIWVPESFYKHTGFNALKKERNPKNDYKEYMAKIREAMKNETQLKKKMVKQLDTATAWAAELGIPLTTTEAWGPWWHMDHPDLQWDWLYDWCEYHMGLSGDYGFWGSTPWNYSHPYWENWKNIEWYKRVNGRFLDSQKTVRP